MRKRLFLILLILAGVFFAWQKSQIRWSRINFVFIGQSIAVASLEGQKNLIILELPNNLYLEVPGGFGNYRLGSVYELGQLENRGGELLKTTLQNYLAVPIDGFIRIANCKLQIANCLLSAAFGRGEAGFDPWQLIKIWWEIKRLRADKMKTINLEETNILVTSFLPDGSEIYTTEFFRLDEIIKKYFGDRTILKERIKIEILNATEERGLAKKLARLISNMGGEVISLASTENLQKHSSLKCLDESIKNSYTVQKLESILSTRAITGEMGDSRADCLILVGRDYH